MSTTKKILPVILAFIVSLLVLLPLVSFANSVNSDLTYSPLVQSGLGDDGDFDTFINNMYYAAIGIAALLAVIKIIVAGIKYMISDISPEKSNAKKDIYGSIIGLVVILAAVLVLNIINPALTTVAFNPPVADTGRINFNDSFIADCTDNPDDYSPLLLAKECQRVVKKCKDSGSMAVGEINEGGETVTCMRPSQFERIPCELWPPSINTRIDQSIRNQLSPLLEAIYGGVTGPETPPAYDCRGAEAACKAKKSEGWQSKKGFKAFMEDSTLLCFRYEDRETMLEG